MQSKIKIIQEVRRSIYRRRRDDDDEEEVAGCERLEEVLEGLGIAGEDEGAGVAETELLVCRLKQDLEHRVVGEVAGRDDVLPELNPGVDGEITPQHVRRVIRATATLLVRLDIGVHYLPVDSRRQPRRLVFFVVGGHHDLPFMQDLLGPQELDPRHLCSAVVVAVVAHGRGGGDGRGGATRTVAIAV